jgi:hypothetical protein
MVQTKRPSFSNNWWSEETGQVSSYAHEHNHVLPHSAFRWQTPDEMYTPAPETRWQRI